MSLQIAHHSTENNDRYQEQTYKWFILFHRDNSREKKKKE